MNDLKNKRFVIFTGALTQGGAERVISILSRRMIGEGFSVEILILRDKEIFYEFDPRVKITVAEQETKSKNLLKNLFFIRKYFKKNADVILSFLAPFNMAALLTHAWQKSKIVVADRNDPRHIPSNPVIRKLRDFLYRFADGVVLQTTQNKAYFGRCVQKKSVVIGNPVDLREKKKIGLIAEKRHEIVTAGRLMPQKNQAMLIEAFAAIAADHPEHTLILYGEGPEREKLEALAKERGVADRVLLPGAVKNLAERIAGSELFVLSSDYEGMANALIEAMCVGLPCISTEVSGAGDLIEPGKNGELIPVGDTEGLIRAMRKLLADKELANRYAQNATAVNEKLAVEKIMGEWLGYLETL